jgi:hypothetical protein
MKARPATVWEIATDLEDPDLALSSLPHKRDPLLRPIPKNLIVGQ